MPPSLSATADVLAKRRGRLLNANQIAKDLFDNGVSPRWVRQTVAPADKMVLGHSTVVWWEQDVLEWLEAARAS